MTNPDPTAQAAATRPQAAADEASDFTPPKPDGFAQAMLGLVEPNSEDAVWTILERLHRRRGFRSSATWLLVLAGGMAGFFFVIKAYSAAVPGLLMYIGAALLLWFFNLLPQARFAHFLRRNDLAEHLLLLPLPNAAYAGAFTRLFIAASFQIALAHLTFWFMLFGFSKEMPLTDPEFLGIFFWLHTGAIGGAWALYWVAVAGGGWWTLPAAYLLALFYNETLPYDQQLIRREETVFKASIVLFWIAGTVLMVWCRHHYAERLRRKLFP
jgi:hypothetical protein